MNSNADRDSNMNNSQCSQAIVAGIGMIPFMKAGASDTYDVMGAQLALQQNLGLGGACVVTLYQAD